MWGSRKMILRARPPQRQSMRNALAVAGLFSLVMGAASALHQEEGIPANGERGGKGDGKPIRLKRIEANASGSFTIVSGEGKRSAPRAAPRRRAVAFSQGAASLAETGTEEATEPDTKLARATVRANGTAQVEEGGAKSFSKSASPRTTPAAVQTTLVPDADEDEDSETSSTEPRSTSSSSTTSIVHVSPFGGVETADFAEAVQAVQLPAEPGFAQNLRTSLGSPATSSTTFSGLSSLVWMVVFALTTLACYRCSCVFKGIQCRMGDYDRLPMTSAEADQHITLGVGELGGGAARTLFVQTEVQQQPQPESQSQAQPQQQPHESAQHYNIASPGGSRSSSPRPVELSRCSSETEPEGELDPSNYGSVASSPRGGAGPPPACVGAAQAALAPAPVPAPSIAPTAAPSAATAAGAVPPPGRGRVSLLFASPLVHQDQARGLVPMPELPFEREWALMEQAYNEAAAALREAHRGGSAVPRPGAVLSAQPLTAGSLQRAVAPVAAAGAASVLHLSAHGVNNHLVLEDGRGTAHFCSCEMLGRMLGLDDRCGPGGVRLVILNACSLRAVGVAFADGGVPHVIGCETDLQDSTSQVFLRALYSSLFQGSTVTRAFSAALVALSNDPEGVTQAAARHFYLLPEGSHQEVLFVPEWPAAAGGEPPASARSELGDGVAVVSRGRSFAGVGSPRLSAAERCRPGRGSWPSDPPSSTTLGSSDGSRDSPDESGDSFGHGTHSVRSSSVSGSVGTLSGCESGGREDDTTSSSDGEAGRQKDELLAFQQGPGGRGPKLEPRQARIFAVPPRGMRRGEVFAAARHQKAASWHIAAMPVVSRPIEVLQSPFGRAMPSMPEDFHGRSREIWSVLQHLKQRRAVVVCGAHVEGQLVEHGVGKSAVLDAVHRAFVLHMGGACVSVQLRALSEADAVISAGGWIEKLNAAVRQALQECQDQWWPPTEAAAGPRPTPTTMSAPRLRNAGLGALRRRARPSGGPGTVARGRRNDVSHGFHPLSDPIALRPALEELIEDMGLLSDLCEARQREWPAASGEVLLVLDECDHLIQQQHFQDAVADLLQRCAAYRVVLSTHQRMVGTAGGQFKVVHQAISGLRTEEAAQLFLRRVQRAIRWEELLFPSPDGMVEVHVSRAMKKVGAQDVHAPAAMSEANKAEVLHLVGTHPVVAAQRGNPAGLIELASHVGPSLRDLSELAVVGLRPSAEATMQAAPPPPRPPEPS